MKDNVADIAPAGSYVHPIAKECNEFMQDKLAEHGPLREADIVVILAIMVASYIYSTGQKRGEKHQAFIKQDIYEGIETLLSNWGVQ